MTITGPVGIGIGSALLLLCACTAYLLHEIRRAVPLTEDPDGPPFCLWCTDKRYALPADCDCAEACGRVYCMRLVETEAAR